MHIPKCIYVDWEGNIVRKIGERKGNILSRYQKNGARRKERENKFFKVMLTSVPVSNIWDRKDISWKWKWKEKAIQRKDLF